MRQYLDTTGACVWFTGLSGAGKSTLAFALQAELQLLGAIAVVLDGDELRAGLNSDLSFSAADRDENIRRIAEIARLLAGQRFTVIVSAISPYRAARIRARGLFPLDKFIEVYVNTPLEVCRQRDVKGLYKLAANGNLAGLSGVDAVYEAPLAPEVEVNTEGLSVEKAIQPIMALLGYVD